MTIGVDIIQRMCHQIFMGQIFVHDSAVPTMTIYTNVLASMDDVPFTLFVHRVFLCMAGGAG